MHMKGHIRDLFLDTVERNDVRDMFLDDVVAVEEGHTGVVLTWGGLLASCGHAPTAYRATFAKSLVSSEAPVTRASPSASRRLLE